MREVRPPRGLREEVSRAALSPRTCCSWVGVCRKGGPSHVWLLNT